MFDRTKVVSRNYENAQKREFPRLPMHHQSFPILSVQSNAIYGHLRVEMSVKMPVLFICHSKSNCSVCLLLHELYSLGKLLNINKQTNKRKAQLVTHHLHLLLNNVEIARHGASPGGRPSVRPLARLWPSVTRPIERIYACVLYFVLYKQRRYAVPLSAAARSDYSSPKSSHLSPIL